MLTSISRARCVGAWCTAVIVIAACSVLGGPAITIDVSELWFAACVVPPAIMLLVWRGVPPATVAELLYAVNRPSTEGGRP